MSKQNKVNPGQYHVAGRLTPDEAARERVKQRNVGSPTDTTPAAKASIPARAPGVRDKNAAQAPHGSRRNHGHALPAARAAEAAAGAGQRVRPSPGKRVASGPRNEPETCAPSSRAAAGRSSSVPASATARARPRSKPNGRPIRRSTLARRRLKTQPDASATPRRRLSTAARRHTKRGAAPSHRRKTKRATRTGRCRRAGRPRARSARNHKAEPPPAHDGVTVGFRS